MAIEATLIQSEIDRIINEKAKPISFFWSAVVHANGNDYPLFAIESIDFIRDYNEEITDSIDVTGMISPGTLQVDISPFSSNLEITLTKVTTNESGEEEVIGETIQKERYLAKLKDGPSQAMSGTVNGNISKDNANMGGMVKVSFQLLNETLEQLRMVIVGGIYKNCTTGNVLRALVGGESKRVKSTMGTAVKGVDMVKPNNETVRDHVIIPHGVKLLGLPAYLQEKCGGVYSAGMGFYLQNGLWYIYPKLDVNRFNTSAKTLTIIVVPENKYPGISRTYRETANQVIFLSTRGISHWDDSEDQQLNFGNGVRFTDANNIMEGFGETEGNKFTVTRKNNANEVILGERENGVNRAMMSSTPITANPFVEYSKMARANCEHLQVTWESANENLLYPGMPCRVVYANHEEITESYGCVLAAQYYIQRAGETLTSKRHMISGTVTVVLGKK